MYDCKDFGVDFVILQHYQSGDYFRFDYSVNDNDVVISEMYQVAKNYLPVGNSEVSAKDDSKDTKDDDKKSGDVPDEGLKKDDKPDEDIPDKDKDKENSNINKEELDKMTLEEYKAKLESAETEIKTLKETVAEKETVISEKDTKINELSEQVNTLSVTVVVKDNEIAELSESKKELDTIKLEKAEAEKANKKVELKDKYSKLLSQEVLSTPEIAEAIESLNESLLHSKVVEAALEKASKTNEDKKDEVVTSSRITDDVNVGDSDILSKYITIGK
jgi:chromosome segregation ATPase